MKLRDDEKKGATTGVKKKSGGRAYYNDDDNDDSDSFEEDEGQKDELKVYNNRRKAHHRKKKAYRARVGMLLLFFLLAAIVCLNWNVFAPSKLGDSIGNFIGSFGKSQFPVSFTEGSMKAAVPLGSDIGVLTDTSFLIYSQMGDLLAVRPHGFNDPAAVSGGGKAIIFDRGGKQFRVETRFSESYAATTTDTITTAAASDSGSFAIVTESSNYLSELTVYNSSYKNVFVWDASQGRILSTAISPDGTKLAAIVVGARGGSMFSDIYIFNVNSQKPVAIQKYDGELLFSINFKDDKNIAVVGQDETVFLSSSGKQSSIYKYEDKELICSSNSNGPVELVFWGVNSLSSVVSLDNSGSLLGKNEVGADVKTVCTGGGNVVFSSRGQIWHTTDNCASISKTSAPSDVLTELSDQNFAYIFGMQSIERLNLR